MAEVLKPMRRRLIQFTACLIAIVLFLVVAEAGAIVLLTIREGRYESVSSLLQRTRNTYIDELTVGGSGCRYVDTLFPHPYLAFVHHREPPCALDNINKIGLFGDDYPEEKRPDRYVVLLAGGSVAAQLGQIKGRGAPKFLEEELNRRYVSPTGKPFLVLNGGDGAWKQPQQLILFMFHADVVDAVLTLDGFNEQYAMNSDVRFEYPGNNFFDVNPRVNRDFGRIVFLWLMGKLAGYSRHNGLLRHSHAAYLISAALEEYVRTAESQDSQGRDSMRNMYKLPAGWPPERRFQTAIGQYKKYMLAMNDIARHHRVLTAHFIQPVPALGKSLSPDEMKAVGDLQYGKTYERMAAELLTLREEGLEVYSLLDLLEGESGNFYADAIHFKKDERWDSPGYRLMARRIGRHLSQAWGLEVRR